MIRDQETLDQLVDIVERFVRDRLIPVEEEVANTNKVPDQIITEMKELGLFGMTIPEEFGGLGLTMGRRNLRFHGPSVILRRHFGRSSAPIMELARLPWFSTVLKSRSKSFCLAMPAVNGSDASALPSRMWVPMPVP